jgi:hypothetical protein
MPVRQVLHFDIADRQQELRGSVAPDDFVLLRRDTAHPLAAYALAYCADLQSERVLYTLHERCRGLAEARGDALFAAPFLYAAQLLSAHGAMSVPFEALDSPQIAATDPAPTLIFSPGRTGSTLLARLLAACRAPCASEPDMLTQICRFEREDRMRIGLSMEIALHRACLASLCRILGPSPFIKLRSQCNARPLPLLQAAPGAAAVFMLRRIAPWALSRHRAFAEPPQSVAAVLRQAIDALDKLLGAGCGLRIVWFEALRARPVDELRRLLSVAAVDSATAAICAVMAQDAQAGTAIERARLTGAVDNGFGLAFQTAWAEARTGAAWSDATLAHLAEMELAEA